MHPSRLINAALAVLLVVLVAFTLLQRDTPRDIDEIRARIMPRLTQEMGQQNLSIGAPIYVRIFKEERVLELWVEAETSFRLFRTYEICNYSGDLGPKLMEGDRQSPEGFYVVTPAAMNPNSRFHLSFNLGFPNAYDRGHERTGSFLMVHGACASIGCYAMTDPGIEEIYVIAEAALKAGQAHFKVHAFPFRMTDDRMRDAEGHQWYAFWENLKEGYDAFEATQRPPNTDVSQGRYVFEIAQR